MREGVGGRVRDSERVSRRVERALPTPLLALASLVLAALVQACAGAELARPSEAARTAERSAPVLHAESWPAPLFTQHGHWVGADSAYSVDLGERRVLWLFGDTFLDPAADGLRGNGPNFFVRNSVGIQTGPDAESAYDPSRARMTFYAGPEHEGVPSSFFHDVDGAREWLWPLHGVLLPDGKLLLFRMHLEAVTGGLGFALRGWDAVAVDEPRAEPARWTPRRVAPRTHAHELLVGSSVLLHGEHLYAYAVQHAARDHSIFLARFALAKLTGLPEGALADPEWFCGRDGFRRQSEGAVPERVFSDGQVELSVHYSAELERFAAFQMSGGFLAEPRTQLSLRTAPAPEGPWTSATPFFRPPEARASDASNLIAYAGKAHPALRGADVVLTYVVNDLTREPEDVIYYPRFVRVRLSPRADATR